MELGIQYIMFYAAFTEHLTEELGSFDRDRTNQNRLFFFMRFTDCINNRVKFLFL